MPPIYAAVFHNQLNVVEYLLQLGVSLEHHGVKCRDPTAVHLAAALGRVEIIPVCNILVRLTLDYFFLFQSLLAHDPLNQVGWQARGNISRMFDWEDWGRIASAGHMVPSCWVAARKGNIPAVELLSVTPSGGNYLTCKIQERTILHEAALAGQFQMLQWLFDNG